MSRPLSTSGVAGEGEVELRGARRSLVFDADASHYTPQGSPCSLCGVRHSIEAPPTGFIRVRERVPGGTRDVALLCPDCIGRAIIQVERVGYWSQMGAGVRSAIQRVLAKRAKRIATPASP